MPHDILVTSSKAIMSAITKSGKTATCGERLHALAARGANYPTQLFTVGDDFCSRAW